MTATEIIVTVRGGIVGLATTPPQGIHITVRDYDVSGDEDDHQVDEDGDAYWEYTA